MRRILEYQDPINGASGWLAYDGQTSRLAAGGCRVHPDVDADELAVLAERMTLKQRVLGTNVDGAKAGLALDPRSPQKAETLGRFLDFLREELTERFSMGPDMGTDWTELQHLAAAAGVPSTKYAVCRAQDLAEEDFFARMALLEEHVGPLTVAQRRAGHALAHAALGAAGAIGVTGSFDCILQGFGNLGRAAALALWEEGVRIVAIGDEHGTLLAPSGLDIGAMVTAPRGTPVPAFDVPGKHVPAEALFSLPADVLVLAGGSDAMSARETAAPPFGAVVVGANCGLSEEAETALHTRGVLAVPDFVGGIGGSASMEALFGPKEPPTASGVLNDLAHLMRVLVADIATASRRTGRTPRAAALGIAGSTTADPAARPYGHCRYLFAEAG